MKKKILLLENADPNSIYPDYLPLPENGDFLNRLRDLGELTLIRNGAALSVGERGQLLDDCDIYVARHSSVKFPFPANPDRIELVATTTGAVSEFADFIRAGGKVTNWGNASGDTIGYAALVLLFAVLHDLAWQVVNIRENGWEFNTPGGAMQNLRIGIYGLGHIGRCFAELARPFGPKLSFFDPYVTDAPADLVRANSLYDLFSSSQAIVVCAGLTAETRRSVTAELLAMLPDQGIFINVARGDIIEEAALFAELAKGRLRAGLDVIAPPDRLPADHPLRQCSKVLFTAHNCAHNRWNPPAIPPNEVRCLEEISRHLAGKAPLSQITVEKLQRMT